jgi:hypothetical protein
LPSPFAMTAIHVSEAGPVEEFAVEAHGVTYVRATCRGLRGR